MPLELVGLDSETVTKTGGIAGLVIAIWSFFRKDSARASAEQDKINTILFQKSDDHVKALHEHEIKVAEAYVKRDEFSHFRSHMDNRFDEVHGILVNISHTLKRGN